MLIDESNRGQAEFWSEVGGIWVSLRERFDTQVNEHGLAALDALAPVLGDRVLDIGCGAGSTTVQIARRVGAAGHVRGLDISPTMIEGAEAYAAEQGVTNTSYAVGDAMAEPFQSDVDGVFSRFGVMFFSDATGAFANIAMALRPAGRIGFVCWQSPASNPWVSVPLGIAGEFVDIPFGGDPTAPGPFSLGDPDRLRSVMEGAGFAAVTIEPRSAPAYLGENLDEAVDFLSKLVPPVMALREEDPAKGEELRIRLTEAMSDWAGPDGVNAPSAVWIVTARRPA